MGKSGLPKLLRFYTTVPYIPIDVEIHKMIFLTPYINAVLNFSFLPKLALGRGGTFCRAARHYLAALSEQAACIKHRPRPAPLWPCLEEKKLRMAKIMNYDAPTKKPSSERA